MASRERGVKFRRLAHRARVVRASTPRAAMRSISTFLLFLEERARLTCQNRKRRAAMRPGASGIDRFAGGGPTHRAALAADEIGG